MGTVEHSLKRMTVVGRVLLLALLCLTLILGSLCRPAYAAGATKRLGGADRYETMAAIVAEGFSRSDSAVIVTGESFPDALAASALAGALGCPIVSTRRDSLPAPSAAALERLGVRQAYVVGGTAAVGEAQVGQLAGMGIGVTRVAGADRFETSRAVMRLARSLGSASDTVIVTTGANFADALSIGPWAYATASPVLLARGDGTLGPGEADQVASDPAVRRVLMVGGEAVVSEAIKGQLGSALEYERVWGKDRYETSAAAARWSVAHGLTWQSPLVASGSNFPDALTGAALGGAKRSPVLLAHAPGDPASQCVAENHASVGTCYVLGGETAVSGDTEGSLSTAASTGQVVSNASASTFNVKDAYPQIEQRSKGSVVKAYTADYDSDGREESFVLTGNLSDLGYQEFVAYKDSELWFVSPTGEVEKVTTFTRAVYERIGILQDPDGSKYKLLTLEDTAGSSYEHSSLFGVHDGRPVDLNCIGSHLQIWNGSLVVERAVHDPYHLFGWLELHLDPMSFVLVDGQDLGRTQIYAENPGDHRYE